jgi:hypothetical protein
MTDTERLDYLQQLSDRSGNFIICRDSDLGRGWRLHETTRDGAGDNIRQAIDDFIAQNERNHKILE